MLGRLWSVQSTFNGSVNPTADDAVSIFANNAEFVAVGAEFNLGLTERLGLSAGVDGAVSGRVIAAGVSWSLGLTWRSAP